MDVDAIENILIEYCDKFDIELENFKRSIRRFS